MRTALDAVARQRISGLGAAGTFGVEALRRLALSAAVACATLLCGLAHADCDADAEPRGADLYSGGNGKQIDDDWLDYARVDRSGRYWLFVNGRRRSKQAFDSIERWAERVFFVVRGACRGLVNHRGQQIVPLRYESVRPVSSFGGFLEGDRFLLASRGSEKWLLRIDGQRGRLTAQVMGDFASAAAFKWGMREFVEHQTESTPRRSGLLDGSLDVLIDARYQSIKSLQLDSKGEMLSFWLASDDEKSDLFDASAKRIVISGTKMFVAAMNLPFYTRYIIAADKQLGVCRYVTDNGLQAVVLLLDGKTASGCPEFVNGHAVGRSSSGAWELLALKGGMVLRTGLIEGADSVISIGTRRDSDQSLRPEFLVRTGANHAIVSEDGSALVTDFDDYQLSCGVVRLRRTGIWYRYEYGGKIAPSESRNTFVPFSC